MFKFDYPDWTAVHRNIWPDVLSKTHLQQIKDKVIIEIGCFEGRSTVWFAERLINTVKTKYICIDTWKGGEEIDRLNLGYDMGVVYKNFLHNINLIPFNDQIQIIREQSENALCHLQSQYYRNVDFIYIDGSHTQRDTLIDLVLSLTMLKVGGIIIVDDYDNLMGTKSEHLRPKKAVDFVVDSMKDEVLFYTTREKQAVIQRMK